MSTQDKDPSDNAKAIMAMDLFTQALGEEDPEKRFNHIKAACKFVTTSLPYKKRIKELLVHKDMFFYLMLLEIFNKKSIALMLNTFLDKLDDTPAFLPLFNQAFIELAVCPESQLRKEGKEVKLDIPPFLIKYVDPNYKRNLNRDILKYMNYIKEIGVEYLRKFTLTKFQTILTYGHNIDIFKIMTSFIANTHIEGLTRKVCGVLKDVLAHEQASVLIKDQKLAEDLLEALKTSENTVRRVLAASERKDSEKMSFRLGFGRQQSKALEVLNQSQLQKNALVEGYWSGEIKNTGLNESFDSFFDESKLATELEKEYLRVQEVFEVWLIESETLSVLEVEDVLHLFRDQRNAQLFLNMIFEPSDVECSDSYYDFYEQIIDKIKALDFPLIGNNFKSIKMVDATSLNEKQPSIDKFENIRMYRAYKCCEILFDEYNWAQITLAVPQFISEFFSRFQQAIYLTTPKINLILMTRIFEMFLRRDPEQMLINLIHHNTPFVLLQNLDCLVIRDFLLNLVNLPLNYYKLSKPQLVYLSMYFKHTDFFIDYLSLILNKNHQLNMQKMQVSYKVKELSIMLQQYNNMVSELLGEANRIRKLPPICAIERPLQKKYEINFSDLAEERNKLSVDVDRIMEYLKPNSEIQDPTQSDSPPKLNTLRSASVQLLHQDTDLEKAIQGISATKYNKMYPSLLEAIRREEENRIRERERELERERESARSTPRGYRGLTTPRGHRGSPSLNKLNVSGERSSLRDSPTPRKSAFPEKNDKPQSNTTISEEGSFLRRGPSLKSISPDKSERRPSSLRPVSKKGKDSPSSQFNLDKLKSVHPEVKLHVFISHFQNINAPLTQAVLNVDALPSKMLGRTNSLPQLSKLIRSMSCADALGSFSQENTFTPEATKESEAQAYPLAVVLEEMIEIYFTNYKQTSLMRNIGLESTSYLEIIPCLQGLQGATFFSLLLKNYLFKTTISAEQSDSSSLICGKIVNTILANLNEHSSLKQMFEPIHRECCNSFPYLCKLLADSSSWKETSKPRVYLQNYVVHEVFGSHRLLLLTTLWKMLENDQKNGFALVNKIPEVFWHALGYWFVELKHQNIFQNIALKIYKTAFKYGSEDLVIKILVKGNMVSQLLIAHNDIIQNHNQCTKLLHAENFMICLKEFVKEVNFLQKTRDNFSRFNTFFTQISSWKKLKKVLLPVEGSPLGSTTTSFSVTRRDKVQPFGMERKKKTPTLGPESLISTREQKLGSQTEREVPRSSILKKINDRRESIERLGDISKRNVSSDKDKNKVYFMYKGRDVPSKKDDTSKTIVLPSVLKANQNHVRSQTVLKTRGASRIK